jgi:predicted Zn finger-like uncharacterized protein
MKSPSITVSCPSCATIFPVDPAKVPARGVHASCSKCGRVFLVEVRDGAGAPPPAPSAREASAPNGGTSPAAPAREIAAGPAGGETPRPGPGEGSKGGNGGAKVDEAADDFREWSSFRDLSFEPDDDGDEAGKAVGATDTADVGATRDEAGSPEAGEGAEGSDAVVMEGEEPQDAADAPDDSAQANSVEATDSMDAAAGVEDPGGATATGDAADGKVRADAGDAGGEEERGAAEEDEEEEGEEGEGQEGEGQEVADVQAEASAGSPTSALDTAADSDVAPEMNPTSEVDTTASLEASSEVEIEAPPTFGRRDPHERAAWLARVLASDMIAYNQDKYEQALKGGTLASDFEEEVEKSWEEYVEQVGRDMAEQNSYFQDALNEILAQGEKLF